MFFTVEICFLIIIIFNKVNSEFIITNSFPDIKYVKAVTLYNECNLLLTEKGIYSFDPTLSNIIYSYNFTDDEILPEDEINYIMNSDISQYTGNDGENNYVLCIINIYLYVINEYGKVLFSKNMSEIFQTYEMFSLVAYKYSDNFYYFTISYCLSYIYQANLLYFKFTFNGENDGDFELIIQKEERITYENNNYWITSLNTSCKLMFLYNNKVLVCFFGITSLTYKIVGFTFNPDNNFTTINMTNFVEESDDKNLNYIKSSINNERTKVLICYNIETSKVKCLYYDIIENQLSNITIESNYCNPLSYGLNTYFFEKSNEYILSCVDDSNNFLMKRLDSGFNIINDELFNEEQFLNCSNLTSFSIVYISEYKVYSIIIHSLCSSNENIRIFQLPNNDYTLISEITDIYTDYFKENICDTDNGYYSFISDTGVKCYQKNELPSNSYYNNVSKFYEYCFPTCATCLKGGNFTENNCLTCASNYIKESENNSTNCINKDNITIFNFKDFFNNIIKSNNNNKDEILFNLKKELINGTLDEFISNIIEKENKDLIFDYENVIYQLTSSYNQNNNNYSNISNINLGECEIKLKNYYNISNNTKLLILKLDITEKGLLIPII